MPAGQGRTFQRNSKGHSAPRAVSAGLPFSLPLMTWTILPVVKVVGSGGDHPEQSVVLADHH